MMFVLPAIPEILIPIFAGAAWGLVGLALAELHIFLREKFKQ